MDSSQVRRDQTRVFKGVFSVDRSIGVRGTDVRRGKFRVRVHVNGKELVVGRFLTLEEAKEARIDAVKKYYGI